MKRITEQERQKMIGLCKIEIRRWKNAAEAVPDKGYMVELMEVALTALKADPVGTARLELTMGREGLKYNVCLVDMRAGLVHADLHTGMSIYTTPPAITTQPAPSGWKMVPVNPTMEQIILGRKAVNGVGKMSNLMQHRLADIYRAMLGVAPAQDAGNE